MHHAAPVRVQSASQRSLPIRATSRSEIGPVARDAVERLAVDELADEERVAVALPQLVERDDRRVVQAGRGLRLAQHPLGARVLDLLDRDVALKPLVEGR